MWELAQLSDFASDDGWLSDPGLVAPVDQSVGAIHQERAEATEQETCGRCAAALHKTHRIACGRCGLACHRSCLGRRPTVHWFCDSCQAHLDRVGVRELAEDVAMLAALAG